MARCSALTILLLASGVAGAAPHPDFTGTWTLDLAASDSTEEMLRAVGRSRVTQKLAGSLSVTQTISQDDSSLTLEISSSVASRKETQKLDGTPTTSAGPDGAEVQARTRWSGDGQALVTAADVKLASGENASFVVTRTLEDGGRTMRQRLELRPQGGKTIVANRIFRRS